MGGMMTLVRVLPPAKYDEIMALVQQKTEQPKAEATPTSHVLVGTVVFRQRKHRQTDGESRGG